MFWLLWIVLLWTYGCIDLFELWLCLNICPSVVLLVCIAWVLSGVWLFATPWTTVGQAPLFMEFSRREYWNGLPFPPPEDLSDPGIKPASPALAGECLTTGPHGKHVGLLDHMIILFLVFWGTTILFSTVATLAYIPTNNVWRFHSPHLL